MRWLNTLILRFRSLFRRARVEDELEAELRFHLEQQSRESLGVRLIDDLRQDVQYSWRGLLQNPGFTLVAALTLALGIGANTAMYSFADATAFRPPDVPRPRE